MPTEQGWGNPNPFSSRTKFHYYGSDGRSLCGRYLRFAGRPELEEGMDDHSDNCATCRRKKKARDD